MRYYEVLLLLLLLLVGIVPTQCFDNNPLDPALNWYMPYDLLQINMAAADTGTAYGLAMIDLLSRVMAGSTNDVYGRHVLAQQRISQPPYRWLMLDLIGRADDRTMIAVRQDNIYVSAFTDKAGTWYVFKNVAALNLVPGATTLSFDNDYDGLVGSGGYKALGSLVLGHEPTLQALGQLAGYKPAPSGNLGGLPRAVAVLVVMLTEAARFRGIATQITTNWESGLALGDLNKLVVNWKAISCSLLLAKQNNDVWEGSKEAAKISDPDDGIGIHTKQQAIDAVLVVLWPWKQKCSKKVTWLV
ncbi:hypothetical protein ACQJBY_037123 [Aegilops geniculata]